MLLYIYKLFLFLNHPVIFYAIKYIPVCHDLGFMVIAFCRKSFLSPLYSPPQFLESNMHDFCKEAFIEKSYILNISNFVIFVKNLVHVILKFKLKRFLKFGDVIYTHIHVSDKDSLYADKTSEKCITYR